MGDGLSHQNRARAGAEHRPRASEIADRFEEPFVAHQREHRAALAAGEDEPIDLRELLPLPDVDRLRARAFDCAAVGGEIALEREHSDLLHYQPRVCSSSPSGSLAISSPGMAAPRSRLASSSLPGLL